MLDLIRNGQRRWRLRRLPPGPLRTYCSQPPPKPQLNYRDVPYIALDFETTGLHPSKDRIVSLGWVLLDGARIDLGTASYRLVCIEHEMPATSAVIHGITDDQAATGAPLDQVFAALLPLMTGRVLIAHHAPIEVGFIKAACRRLYGAAPWLRTVDTMALAKRQLERKQTVVKPGALRLHTLSEQYNLPRLGAHHALSDALLTAELFLAQAAYQETRRGLTLGDLMC